MQLHVFVRSLLVIQTGILKHDSKLLPCCHLVADSIYSIQLDRAAAGTKHRRQHLHRGRLAGTIGPQEGEDLPLLDIE